MSEKEVKEYYTKYLIQAFTKKVSYTGSNNRKYTTICKPSQKDIRIQSVEKIFVPKWRLTFLVLNHRYEIETYDKKGAMPLIVKHDLDKCTICKQTISKERFLCNECGSIVHKGFFSNKHVFTCKECNKIICKECAKFKRYLLFFKRAYCTSCT